MHDPQIWADDESAMQGELTNISACQADILFKNSVDQYWYLSTTHDDCDVLFECVSRFKRREWLSGASYSIFRYYSFTHKTLSGHPSQSSNMYRYALISQSTKVWQKRETLFSALAGKWCNLYVSCLSESLLNWIVLFSRATFSSEFRLELTRQVKRDKLVKWQIVFEHKVMFQPSPVSNALARQSSFRWL